jgi:hypothetical protein
VQPLNEHILLAQGITPGGAVVEQGVQCDVGDLQALKKMEPVKPPEPPPPRVISKYVLPPSELPKMGEQLSVLWCDATGENWSWWGGAVEKIEPDEGGVVLHGVRYQKAPDTLYWHDLAKDRALNRHPWKIEVEPESPRPVEPKASQHPMRTRQRVENHTTGGRALLCVLDHLDHAIDVAVDPVSVFNALTASAFGELADDYECIDPADLGACRVRLHHALTVVATSSEEEATFHVNAVKKGQDTVEVVTALGDKVTLKVPRGGRAALDKSAEAASWYEADRVAFHDAILALPGNELVLLEEVRAEGHDLLHMSTTRRVKLDRASGMLASRNPFKSRHSVDEKRQRAAGGSSVAETLASRSTYTVPVDDLVFKTFMSALRPGEMLVALDWKNAYGLGHCQREPRYVIIPETVDAEDEAGRRMCLRLVTSLWGEGVAGFEWECTRDEDLRDAGWEQCVGVPALFRHGDACHGIVIVDDLLIKVPRDGNVHELTHAALSAKAVARGGAPLSIDLDVESWGGWKIERSPDRMAVTISLPNHLEQAVARWLPELLGSDKLPSRLLTKKQLRTALDGLKLCPTEGRLSKDAKDMQRITGELRYIVKSAIRLLRNTHKLSCVMQAPPSEGKLCAESVLAQAWLHRESLRFTYSHGYDSPEHLGLLAGSMDSARGAAIVEIDGAARMAAQRAPVEAEGVADSTWSRGDCGDKDVYALAVTRGGAAIVSELRMIKVIMPCSTTSEGYASVKVSDRMVHVAQIETQLGVPSEGPALLASDSASSLRVASGHASVVNCRHALRRWAILTQRVVERAIRLGHVRDEDNPIDFATKWVSEDKVDASCAYLTGARSRALHFPT